MALRRVHLLLLGLAALGLACRGGDRSRPPSRSGVPARDAPGVPASDLARALPASLAEFSGGSLSAGPGFVRRTYTQGSARIEVTLACDPMSAAQYSLWLAQVEQYPAARLPLPPGTASAFYSCDTDAASAGCDLHAQLRAGYHLEMMSGGTATREQLSALAQQLPLAPLTSWP